jgi:hypothetical protein
MNDRQHSDQVVVIDVQMPFWSMVIFMVKLAIAAIPAFFLLIALGFAATAILGGFAAGLGSWRLHSSDTAPVAAPQVATPSVPGVTREMIEAALEDGRKKANEKWVSPKWPKPPENLFEQKP